MRLRKSLCSLLAVLVCASASADSSSFGLPATPGDIERVFWGVFPNGEHLPQGSGNVVRGKALFEQQCAMCHGQGGKEGIADTLVGGKGSLILSKPQTKKTIGSYWPYATSLFDYIRRAMPLTAPMSLSNDDYYALTVYLLQINGIVDETTVLDKNSLPSVAMPNRDNFINAYPNMPEQYRY